MSKKILRKRSRQRSQRAFSLVSVLIMAGISSIWMIAMAAMIVPTYQKISLARSEASARAGAESALDWAVAQLNNTMLGQASGLADDATQNGVPNPVSWTAGTAAPADRMPANTTAQVWVNNVPPPPDAPVTSYVSYLYDQQLDPAINTSIPGGNGWRQVTATAVCGPYRKTVRVILKPSYQQSFFFNFAAYVQNSYLGNGSHSTQFDAYNSSGGPVSQALASLGSSGVNSAQPITLGGSNASIGGSVNYYGPAATDGQPNINLNGATIGGDLYTNDPQSVALTGAPANNVIGKTVVTDPVTGVQTTMTDTTGTPTGGYHANQTSSPPSLTVPSPPATAVTLSSSFSGSLPAGDYIVSSLTNTITPTGSGDVRIWVQNTLSMSGGSGDLTNLKAEKLQIFYQGSGSISISGNSQMCAAVFAPNSSLTLNGNGHFYGSAVVNGITDHGSGNSGGFSYDTSLYKNPAFQIPQEVKMQTVSWQEL